MAYHGPSYGLTAELEAKKKASYDMELERNLRSWIESVSGERLAGSFQESLKSGVVLCKLVNSIRPNTIRKISTGKMPFIQMENIEAFLTGARSLGVQTHDVFMTVDLYEDKNMNQVCQCLNSLKRIAGGGKAPPRSTASAPPDQANSAPAPAPARAPAPAPARASGGGAAPKFCPNCGSKTSSSNAKFCGDCGNKY